MHYLSFLIFILSPALLASQVLIEDEIKRKKVNVSLTKCTAEYYETFDKNVTTTTTDIYSTYEVEQDQIILAKNITGQNNSDYETLFENGIVTPKMFLCEYYPDCIPPELMKSESSSLSNFYTGGTFTIVNVIEIEAIRTIYSRKYKIFGSFDQVDDEEKEVHVFYIELNNLNANTRFQTKKFVEEAELICLQWLL